MSPSTAKQPPGQTKTVLLAEDDEIVRKMLNEILTAEGYTIIPKADGREALNYFREHSREIDLIVTDIVMPNMDGRELGRNVVAGGRTSAFSISPATPTAELIRNRISSATRTLLPNHSVPPNSSKR